MDIVNGIATSSAGCFTTTQTKPLPAFHMPPAVTSKRRSNYSKNDHNKLSSLFKTILVFFAGWVIGFHHGQKYSDEFDNGKLLSTSYPLLQQQQQQRMADDDESSGWKTIHVFYGKRDLLDDTKTASKLNIPDTQPIWWSQARQDEIVISLFNNKKNGYFIDLAANDATYLSNTYALEKFWNWTGICIEPNPIYWSKLSYRKCTPIGAIVGKDKFDEVIFNYKGNEIGSITNMHEFSTTNTGTTTLDNSNNNEDDDIIGNEDYGYGNVVVGEKRYTVTLLEILQERIHNVPKEIDYLSLDVEGAELFILQSFPLNEYNIKVITIERLPNDGIIYMNEHNYEFVTDIVTEFGETLWVHKHYKDQLDWSILNKYKFPLEKWSVF